MPFLLPAVSAALADSLLLYVNSGSSDRWKSETSDETSRFVYSGGYMIVTACIRLFLLAVPLPYHSYNGTALKCPALYQLLYGCTLILLLIQCLSLSMVDPTSLQSLLPSNSSLTAHDHLTRHIWIMLILSLISDLCHIILFLHVRSTAPAHADLSKRRPRVLFYYAKEQEDTERDHLLPEPDSFLGLQRAYSTGSASEGSVHRISRRMVSEVQHRLKQAKDEWEKRLADYRMRSAGTGSQDLIQRPLTAFRVLLQLFAYEDVLSNGRLDAIFEQDNGATLMNFVPQLLSFLLHGAYDSSTDLEVWILDTCRKNVHFAHRCFWFLRAWSLESKKLADGVPALLSRSSSLASFDNGDSAPSSVSEERSLRNISTLLPEERAVIEGLLQQVMKNGEEPARKLYFGNGVESEEDEVHSSYLANTTQTSAAESGTIPVDPGTGMPSVRHWEAVAATRKFGFLPLDQSLAQQRNAATQATSYFDATPVFLDALLTMAENLFRVPRENRSNEFKRQLQLLEVQALPNNAIYLPVQNGHHRVWRIVADESIAINTKERVPCIICLEVIDYKTEEAPQKGDIRQLLERVAPADTALHFPDITRSLSEQELINRWRFGNRDPHRRDTAFEKLASQMREKMRQIPLDQMKSSMKEQLDKVKNANIQDFLSLTISASHDEGSDLEGEDLHAMDPTPGTDMERGEAQHESGTPSKGLPKRSSPFAIDSPRTPSPTKGGSHLGQWTPPAKNLYESDPDLPPMDDLLLPRRSQAVSYQRMNSANNGSERKSILNVCNPRSKNNDDPNGKANGKPPTAAKPPQVVFKENWKEKEERLRPSSAYGNHPGWKLLPVLVKANDDLRQEQLASQIIYRISAILAKERVPVWLCPYEILALTESGGIIEAIPDTISISSLKKNVPNYSSLKGFFHSFFDDPVDLADAKANFCESLAGYSMVCFLLQMKDRHNGNILLDNRGHLIHIDFGFFFLSSPGKNTGFESAPFKLTREFVDVLDGPHSRMFRIFRMLCYRSFIALRRHCLEIILLVEMLKKGNEDLPCFRGRPDDAIQELRDRFRLDLNDRACFEYVNALIDESLENWRTNWYDRYQRYCVGVL